MILFQNHGTLDVRAITTFGVSSKEGDDNIGFFGTGLKYAIAILLREGCTVRIITGGIEYNFETRKETIRVDNFDTVWMITKAHNAEGVTSFDTEQRLGFTTELGKTWDMWQCFRELWCNTTDEAGDATSHVDDYNLTYDGTDTYVIVTGAKFEKAYAERFETALLPPKTILHDDMHIAAIHSGESNYVYYRGIRAYTLHQKSMFTHNIRMPMELSEDRNMKWEFRIRTAVGSSIVCCKDESLIEQMVTAPEGVFEYGIDYTSVPAAGLEPTFIEVVQRIARTNPSKLNRSAMTAVKVDPYESLPETTDAGVMDAMQSAVLDKAIAFCRRHGYMVDMCNIVVMDKLENGVMGLAHRKRKTIYLSKIPFDLGTKQVVSTLIEEFIHIELSLDDCTREMQSYLFDKIVSKCEMIDGEAV